MKSSLDLMDAACPQWAQRRTPPTLDLVGLVVAPLGSTIGPGRNRQVTIILNTPKLQTHVKFLFG